MKFTAVILLCKCQKHKGKLFGMRTQLVDESSKGKQQIWTRTWAFPIDANKAKKEGYDKSSISGTIIESEKYPGCPYCGTHSFTLCGACNKLTCYSGEKNVTCQWCGNSGPVGDNLKGNETFSADGNY